MNTSSTRTAKKRLVLMVLLAIVVVALDQLSKAWIRSNLAMGDELDVWSGVVHLSHVHNYGAAWSILSGQRWLLIVISGVVLAVVLSVARGLCEKSVLGAWSIGFIVGGATGNLIDRVSVGYVVDMIDMDTSWSFLRTFPVFNLADSALTVGVILLMWLSLRPEETVTETAAAPAELPRH